MLIAVVATCLNCGAVVNLNWEACASCSHPTRTIEDPANETPIKEGIVDSVKISLRPSTHLDPPLHPRDPWLQVWRELANMTQGIQENDWRFPGIMDLLNGCDQAFENNAWTDFERLSEKVKTLSQRK